MTAREVAECILQSKETNQAIFARNREWAEKEMSKLIEVALLLHCQFNKSGESIVRFAPKSNCVIILEYHQKGLQIVAGDNEAKTFGLLEEEELERLFIATMV